MTEPVIGLIVPPAAGEVPPEAYGLFPKGVRFAARGLGLARMATEDYGDAVTRVRDVSRQLAQEDGAEAIALMGTSLSFFRGGAFNDELVEIIQQETGLPATTMTNAVRDALRALGARRIAVGTAYSEEVNAQLRRFLEDAGFEIAAMTGMGKVEVEDVLRTTPQDVTDHALHSFAQAEGPVDALFLSCGGLPAQHLARAVEPRIGVPVVASATAGVRAAVQLLGIVADAPDLGTLARVAPRAPAHPQPAA